MTIDGLNQIAATFAPNADSAYNISTTTKRFQNAYLAGSLVLYNGNTNAVSLMAGTLTAARAISFGDFAGVVVIDTAAQTLTNKTLSSPAITGTPTFSAPITVPDGGTALATLTAHALYVGNGASAPNPVALGTTGQVLTSNGASADPTFQTVAAGVSSIADATNGGLNFSAATGAVAVNLMPSDLLTKATPLAADSVVIMDSAASNAAKTATISSIVATSSKLAQAAVTATSNSVTTDTNGFTFNSSVPTTANGTQFLTVNFTAKNAGSTLVIQVMANLSTSGTNANLAIALFEDAGTNALAVGTSDQENPNRVVTVPLTYIASAANTSAHTFTVRGGADNGTTTFNGASGSGLFGGTLISSITITEYLP